MLDAIIVGQGISGTLLAWEFYKNNQPILVIDNGNANTASQVAAGIYNPIVLKRFTKIWNAEQQTQQLNTTYKEISDFFGNNYQVPMPIKRILHNEAETITWQKKAQTNQLNHWLQQNIEPNTNQAIHAKYGFGTANNTGKIRIKQLITDFRETLLANQQFSKQEFNYQELIIKDHGVTYQKHKAKRIIFCQGIAANQNPYTKHFPIVGNKGNVLQVQINQTLPAYIYKSKVFLMQHQGNQYYVGATYEREYQDDSPTASAKKILAQNLKQTLNINFNITQQQAAIRPTVADRKPIVGQVPNQKNMYILNGMGSRGTILAPTMAKTLYQHLQKKTEIPVEVNSLRFAQLF